MYKKAKLKKKIKRRWAYQAKPMCLTHLEFKKNKSKQCIMSFPRYNDS